MLKLIFIVFIVWVAWATFSTGGLYNLKNMNPDYPHKYKSVPYLISQLNYTEQTTYWSHYHVEQCSLYMPDWAKAERCVRLRISCELKSPRRKDNGFEDYADIFSEEFWSCFDDIRPFMGPSEWLRASRAFWRIGIGMALIWVTGGADAKGDSYVQWEKDNLWWGGPVLEWMEKGS